MQVDVTDDLEDLGGVQVGPNRGLLHPQVRDFYIYNDTPLSVANF